MFIKLSGCSEEKAKNFTKKFVLIARSDLKKIERLAKKLKFYEELKKLNINMQEITLDSTLEGK